MLPAAKVAHNWFTWWGGDLFGVVVFLPLMLTLPGAPTRLRWRGHALGSLPVAGLLILLLSLGVTFNAWKMVAHFVYEKNAAEFAALAQESEKALQHRIDSYQQVLWSGVGFFQGAKGLRVPDHQGDPAETRHTLLPVSSAINNPPWLSTASPTGRPRALSPSTRKPVTTSSAAPTGWPFWKGT